jgi:hypothetical protein
VSTFRPACAVVGALLSALLLAACGSGSTTTTNASAGNGASRPNRRPDSAQFQKLRAAPQTCGVDFRGGPPNGQPPPQGQGQGTASTSAS